MLGWCSLLLPHEETRPHLQTFLQDFFCLGPADSAVDGNLFISPDAEGPDSVSGCRWGEQGASCCHRDTALPSSHIISEIPKKLAFYINQSLLKPYCTLIPILQKREVTLYQPVANKEAGCKPPYSIILRQQIAKNKKCNACIVFAGQQAFHITLSTLHNLI